MDSIADHMTWSTWLFVVFNVMIVVVYIGVVTLVVPRITSTDYYSRVCALIFCSVSAANYLEISMRTLFTPYDAWITTVHHPWILIIRGAQAVSLTAFVYFYRHRYLRDLRQEEERVRSALGDARNLIEGIDRVGG